jgi:hypothetical protein
MNPIIQTFAGLMLIFLFFIFMMGIIKLGELFDSKENDKKGDNKEDGDSKRS